MTGKEIYIEMLEVATIANEIQSVIQLLPPGQYDMVRTILANELKTQTDLFDGYASIEYLSDFEKRMNKKENNFLKPSEQKEN